VQGNWYVEQSREAEGNETQTSKAKRIEVC
jgi:hypothetical protein